MYELPKTATSFVIQELVLSQVKQLALHPLFYTPLLVHEVADAQTLNHALMQEIALLRASQQGMVRSNYGGWHSNDDLINRPEPCFKQVCQHIVDAIRATNHKVAPSFNFDKYDTFMEGWVNVQGNGDLNTPHDHAAWAWSGVYYVSVPEASPQSRAGCIEFIDSRTNLHPMTVEGAPCFSSKFQLRPQAGQIIVFPSYLTHWVYPNDSEQERISIAFNVRFMKKA